MVLQNPYFSFRVSAPTCPNTKKQVLVRHKYHWKQAQRISGICFSEIFCSEEDGE